MLVTQFLILLFLIVLNGFFAMSEIAVVSARKSRLEAMRQEGRRGAASAIRLTEDPTGFLSTVQIGITLVGIFAGAYGGSVFAAPLAEIMRDWPVVGAHAGNIAFVLVVVVITYLSLIIGELAPKRFALSRAEAIAVWVAPVMSLIARFAAPVVWLLTVSTNAVMKLLGDNKEDDERVTEEDVKAMIAEGTQSGVFKPKEKEMLEGVIRIADRSVRSIMVPRPDTSWLDRRDSADILLDKILKAGHSRYPVIDTATDAVVGIVQTKDLLEQQRRTGTVKLDEVMREPLFVNETMPILKLLERFRAAGIHMAVVLDEYGSFEGVATPTDILQGIAGALPEGEDDNPRVIARGEGSWLIDAAMPVDAIGDAVPGLAFPAERDYETAAGFVLDHLGHIPDVGERFRWERWDIEVVDLDGQRVDKLLVSKAPIEDEAEAGAQAAPAP